MGGEPSRTYFRPWMYGYIIALCDEKEPVNLSMLVPSSLASRLNHLEIDSMSEANSKLFSVSYPLHPTLVGEKSPKLEGGRKI